MKMLDGNEQIMCRSLAVVILNYNSATDTIRCVNQLINFNLPFHIIVVDNNSIDSSYEDLKSLYGGCNVDVIQVPNNNGYSAGNNIGIKYGETKYGCSYCAILNPDVIVPTKDTIVQLLRTIQANEKCGVIGATVIDRDGYINPQNSAWSIPRKCDFIKGKFVLTKNKTIQNWKYNGDGSVEVECIAGCFFIASIGILKEIGYLDESIFLYNEELLLGYNLRKKGYKEFLKLDCFYYHMHKKRNPPTLKTYLGQRRIRFSSDVILYNKIYKGFMGLVCLKLIEFVNRVILFPWFVIKPIIKR